MNKSDLVSHVANEGAKLKLTIINALAESDPQSQLTASAVTQLFSELNEIVQSAHVGESK